MGRHSWLVLALILALAGCTSSVTPGTDDDPTRLVAPSAETSIGDAVEQDNPDLPRADFAGNTPDEVVLAYVRATNRQDWKTRWALIAPPKETYAAVAATWEKYPVPYDDFKVHETRVVEPNRALVRVTYSTIGFSAQEGLTDEESRGLVVVRDPGEWWVVEKGDTDDAVWGVTFKGPQD
jgi:hypothetical protein